MLALPNGNFVVGSPDWRNGPHVEAGFAMLASGQVGVSGHVDPDRSLVGGASYDRIGQALRLLGDGNWLAISIGWGTPGAPERGAITWGHASVPPVGTVSPLNSLVGQTALDRVGWTTPVSLADGSYLVQSPYFDADGIVDAGAVTYGAAGIGVRGVVSAQNSILGSTPNGGFSQQGLRFQASDYAIADFGWRNASGEILGAVVFPDSMPPAGLIIDNRPLLGRSTNDRVVGAEAAVLRSGHRLSVSAFAESPAGNDAGRVTIVHPNELPTTVSAGNSVYGAAAGGGSLMTYLIDQTRNQIVVADPRGEQVTLVRPGAPTTTTLSIDGGKPFLPGVPVVFVVTVAAQTTLPTGPALVTFGNGQSCSDATPTAITPVVARFACAVVPSTAGDIPVWAEFPGTREHGYSGTPAQQLTVLPTTIFGSGFESGAVPAGG
jgi:hypothetical protein